ncbi:MAG: T9SS type A sorting domain-containing protein, partial [Bacteroidota bacterium]|nr:T9SS type A sorting domain-containing protein [Bacteroidota bacterium]
GSALSARCNVRLIDNYSHTEIILNLSSTTVIPFSITTDSASAAPARFMVIVRAENVLPVSSVEVKAFKKEAGVEVQWRVEDQTGIERYEVEKSTNGMQFQQSAMVVVRSSSALPQTYSWNDENIVAGNNFYRIKYIDKTQANRYSNQVCVNVSQIKSGITIYPNPVKDNTIHLSVTNMEKSVYSISIYNVAGEMVYVGSINHIEASKIYKIATGKVFNKGIYTFRMSNSKTTFSANIIFE